MNADVLTTCEGRCERPPNRGIRQVWWCAFREGGRTTDHNEHDHYYQGKWYHCYG